MTDTYTTLKNTKPDLLLKSIIIKYTIYIYVYTSVLHVDEFVLIIFCVDNLRINVLYYQKILSIR